MSGELRRNVLKSFKELHRTRLKVFNGDANVLSAARTKINEEYKKCKHVQDPVAIHELLKYSREVDNELKTTVIQAQEVQPGKFEARISGDIVKMDNVPFKECSGSQRS